MNTLVVLAGAPTPTALVLAGLPASVLILGIVQGIKEAGMPSRFALLVSILVGLLIGVAAEYEVAPHDYVTGAALGINAGLVASGLYSGVKAISALRAPTDPPPVA
jgi:hypothetical protein